MKITESKLRNIIRSVIAENMGDRDITADPGLHDQNTHDPSHKDFDHASSAEEHPFLDIFSQMCSAWMTTSDAMIRKQIENAAQSLLDESEKDVATFRRCLENTCAPESLDAILPRDFYW